jgi:uncharacterized protein (TIGR03437 family)
MSKKLMVLICGLAALACAAPPFSFQTHYLQLGLNDRSVAIVADKSGNIFIVSQIIAAGTGRGRVTKTDSSGKVLAVMTLGENTYPQGAAVDPQGNVVVVCSDRTAKLDNALTGVLVTSPLGGYAITTDTTGSVWITGIAANDFPTTPGAYGTNPPPGPTYAFVAELSPDLSKTIVAALYGGVVADCSPFSANCQQPNGPGLPARTTPTAIAMDPSGAVVIAGYTTAAGKLGIMPYNHGFVARLSADLTSLLADAFFNPAADLETYFFAMAFDSQGNLVLVGNADEVSSFSATALQPSAPSIGGGIVLKVDNTLQNLLWGTFFGASESLSIGPRGDSVRSLMVDAQDHVWITGRSEPRFLPSSTSTSFEDLPFIAELTPDGSAILNLISSQFGGNAITSTPNGGFAVLGATDSFLLTVPPDQPTLLMVANSANNHSSGTIAPAELISLLGTGIGPASPIGGVVVDGAFTTTLGGYQVLFNGVPAPLVYAGPDQINVVSPAAIGNQQSVDINVVGPQGATSFPTVFVASARPQIFSELRRYAIDGSTLPGSFALANNQDGTLNTESNPAHAGSIVTIWATGLGLAMEPMTDGAIVDRGSDVNLPITTNSIQVLYAGQAPSAIQGLMQINLKLPTSGLGVGPPFRLPIYIELDGSRSESVDISVIP